MNFYKHYIGDFQRDTRHLSLTECGAYRAMLDHHYATEHPLPKGVKEVCRLVGAQSKAERAQVRRILDEFWTLTETGFVNRRAGEEITKFSRIREKSRENGGLGGRPLKPRENPAGFETKTQPEPNENLSQKPESLLRKAATAAGENSLNGPIHHSKPEDKSWLFRDGLIWLKQITGRAEQGLRSQIGRWLKTAKEDAGAVRSLIETARDQQVAEPVAWITKALAVRTSTADPVEPADDQEWRQRLQSYKDNGEKAWPGKWGGSRPGDHPAHPKDLLLEFGFVAGPTA